MFHPFEVNNIFSVDFLNGFSSGTEQILWFSTLCISQRLQRLGSSEVLLSLDQFVQNVKSRSTPTEETIDSKTPVEIWNADIFADFFFSNSMDSCRDQLQTKILANNGKETRRSMFIVQGLP